MLPPGKIKFKAARRVLKCKCFGNLCLLRDLGKPAASGRPAVLRPSVCFSCDACGRIELQVPRNLCRGEAVSGEAGETPPALRSFSTLILLLFPSCST